MDLCWGSFGEVVAEVVEAGGRTREVVATGAGWRRLAGEGLRETSVAVGVASLVIAVVSCSNTLICLYGGVDGDLDVLGRDEEGLSC